MKSLLVIAVMLFGLNAFADRTFRCDANSMFTSEHITGIVSGSLELTDLAWDLIAHDPRDEDFHWNAPRATFAPASSEQGRAFLTLGEQGAGLEISSDIDLKKAPCSSVLSALEYTVSVSREKNFYPIQCEIDCK